MTILSPYKRAWLDRALISITAAEAGPSALELDSAPDLDLWRPQITVIGELVLEGDVRGHPILGNNTIITSPVIALDPDDRWARTVSSWYRLRRHHPREGYVHRRHPYLAPFLPPDRAQIDRRLQVYIEWLREMDARDRQARGRADKDGH
ncbi:DUF6634 family protein [Falsirhodobacter sp. alg1]|uniref:DUF6634 family protein n=1 Tax=Falsirhodobacter sp. alg1 TaxID=1472418 RepID=UPI0005EDA800|nr:DUF6634 family protein [Falsirhodobacter sp. alg1]